jgi:predicted RNA-binding Zn-ribbon protein involved in translation (DUF1610 family)
MSTAVCAEEIPPKKMRCPDCGVKGEFPGDFTPTNVAEYCDVCRFHRNHDLTYDFRCPMCIARLWLSRLQALRILLLHSATMRSEETR